MRTFQLVPFLRVGSPVERKRDSEAGVLRVARERERDVRKKEIARARRKSGVLRVERERKIRREKEKERWKKYVYIYDGGKERVGEGVERRRSRGDAVVGVREEERSVSRTTKRAEKHKSQATGARHVVCIGEVRITGTRSLPKDGAKAPCYVYCP